jgi:hypothetical protein
MHHRPYTSTGLYGHIYRQGKGKNGKAVSVHDKKAHIGCSRGTVPLIFNLEVSWRGAIDHLVFCSRICVRVGVSAKGVVLKTQTFEEERRRKRKKKQKQTRKEKLVNDLQVI